MTRREFLPELSAYSDIDLSLETILSWMDKPDWREALVHNTYEGGDSEVSKAFRDASFIGLKDYAHKVNEAISVFVEDYASRNNLGDLELESMAVVKYTEGQFFSEHSDGGPHLPRRLSMVIYLNDNYSGGEIYFTKFKSVFKPGAGTLFLFPPTEEYSHAAQPVVEGTKYVVVGFWK
jgi:hypothetical protein